MARLHIVGYLSIDTVTTPTQRFDAVPGGAALYAALGARLAGAPAALHVAAGADWPATWTAKLASLGIATDHLDIRPGPTRRSRLAYQSSDERRSDHHGDDSWWERTGALAPPMPDRIDRDDLVIAGPMPAAELARLLDRVGTARTVGDTSEAFAMRARDALLRLIGRLTVFAPSQAETRRLYPDLGDDDALRALAGHGCAAIQKRGARGLALCRPHARHIATISASAADAIDPTGAGDATVGALAGRLLAGDDVETAARFAVGIGGRCVAAAGPYGLGFSAT